MDSELAADFAGGDWTGWSTMALLVYRVTLRAYETKPGHSPCLEGQDPRGFDLGF